MTAEATRPASRPTVMTQPQRPIRSPGSTATQFASVRPCSQRTAARVVGVRRRMTPSESCGRCPKRRVPLPGLCTRRKTGPIDRIRRELFLRRGCRLRHESFHRGRHTHGWPLFQVPGSNTLRLLQSGHYSLGYPQFPGSDRRIREIHVGCRTYGLTLLQVDGIDTRSIVVRVEPMACESICISTRDQRRRPPDRHSEQGRSDERPIDRSIVPLRRYDNAVARAPKRATSANPRNLKFHLCTTSHDTAPRRWTRDARRLCWGLQRQDNGS